MKVYLINPKFEPTIWSFEGLEPFTGTQFSTVPLGLATVAALTPSHWTVEIADENVEDIDFSTDADLIGITAFNVQYKRAIAIAAKFRKRGKAVVIGGPYCSLFPEAFEGQCDYRISGEAEDIWPEFLSDFEQGRARELYVQGDKKPDLSQSPVPRFDLIRGRRYNMFSLQTTRGCPFSCEFCDIIVMDGRVPRSKSIDQVLAEVDHCVKQGAHYIVFADANFVGNLPFARKLLTALADYQKKRGYPLELSCELTINVAHHPDLLELLQEANFYSLFIGIESPRHASLVESKKLQNTRKSVVEDIHRIQSYHLSVVAGMIVGFDSDDKSIFQEQFHFLQELGIPFTTCGTLVALPRTPLLRRLEAENRILQKKWTEVTGHGDSSCNFIPKQMSFEELQKGYRWLIRCLYRYDAYSDRVVGMLSRFQNRNKEHKRVNFDIQFFIVVVKIFIYYLFTKDQARRHFFVTTLNRTAKSSPFSTGKWLEFFRWIATYRSFREHVFRKQGCPEESDPSQPLFTLDDEKAEPVMQNQVLRLIEPKELIEFTKAGYK